MYTWDFENLQHIPGNLEGHTWVCACLEKTWESPSFSLTLRLCKQEVKAKEELWTTFHSIEGISQHIHKAPQQRLGHLLIQGSKEKSLSNHYLAIKLVKQRLQWPYTVHRLYSIISEKSLNKQQQQTPGRGIRFCYIID